MNKDIWGIFKLFFLSSVSLLVNEYSYLFLKNIAYWPGRSKLVCSGSSEVLEWESKKLQHMAWITGDSTVNVLTTCLASCRVPTLQITVLPDTYSSSSTAPQTSVAGLQCSVHCSFGLCSLIEMSRKDRNRGSPWSAWWLLCTWRKQLQRQSEDNTWRLCIII